MNTTDYLAATEHASNKQYSKEISKGKFEDLQWKKMKILYIIFVEMPLFQGISKAQELILKRRS